MVKNNEHSAPLKRQILVKIISFLCPKIVMDTQIWFCKLNKYFFKAKNSPTKQEFLGLNNFY